MTKMMLPAAMLAGVLSVGNGVAMESAADSASSLDGAYFGLGLGGNFLDNTLYAGDVKLNKSANRFMGTAILGAGKVFGNKLYAGVEGLVDFAKKSNVRTNKDDIEVAFKNRGIVPELALRLGYVYNTYMFYGKIGCSFGKTDTYASDGDVVVWGRVNKAVPTLSLGVEKAFCGKFSARLEGEYVFKGKENFTGVSLRQAKGWNVRAIGTYSVKF